MFTGPGVSSSTPHDLEMLSLIWGKKIPHLIVMAAVLNRPGSEPVHTASWEHCGPPPYRMWLLLLLELPDGFLGLLQLSTGLLALLFDCGQLPLDQVVLLCLLSSSHLSLGT